MKLCRFVWSVLATNLLILIIIGPIIVFGSGCSTKKKHINVLSRRHYLPDSYSTNFVLGGPGSGTSKMYVRDKWPVSPEAVRAVKSDKERVYEHSSYSYNTSANGRPNDYYSYRIVTTSVK